MLSFFRRRRADRVHFEHELRDAILAAEFRDAMKHYFDCIQLDITNYPFENQVLMFVANGAADICERVTGARHPHLAKKIEERAATIILAVQGMHFMYRAAFPGHREPEPRSKSIVHDNMLAMLLGTDLEFSKDTDKGEASYAAISYSMMLKKHRALMEQLDRDWARFFYQPTVGSNGELANRYREIVAILSYSPA
jgi:hypothetical protein